MTSELDWDWPLFALFAQNWNSSSVTYRVQGRDAVTGAQRWALTRPTACVGAVSHARGVVCTSSSSPARATHP